MAFENMELEEYGFAPGRAFETIAAHWSRWALAAGAKKWVVGISGGKDSTVVAALAVRIFGTGNVIGVMMPNGVQADAADAVAVCRHVGIKSVVVNIGRAYEELLDEVTYGAVRGLGLPWASEDTKINLPARLRMATLYAVAQTVGGFVLNTCNLSEDVCGYSTLFGDNAGSYAPIQKLTVTEIRALGDWFRLPRELVHKTPVDGLQPKTDEEKLGFTYAELDRFIRQDKGTPEFKERIGGLFRRNRFKTDIVRLPSPDFGLPNYVETLFA